MFCSLYKWYISQALDSKKTIPGPVNHHLRRCSSCQEFAKLCESLEDTPVQDRTALPKKQTQALNEKIISALEKESRPKPTPSRRPVLIPVLSATLALLVISVGIIWLTAFNSNKMTPFDYLSEFKNARASLGNAFVKIDSPYEEEILELKEAVQSTTKYLISCFDISIGQKGESQNNKSF